MASRKKKVPKEVILASYEYWDTEDVSTERLLALVSDDCGCDVEDVVEALMEEQLEEN